MPIDKIQMLIQKTEHPKRQCFADRKLDVVLNEKRVLNTCDLFSAFCFSSDFKNKLIVYFKICRMGLLHFMPYK